MESSKHYSPGILTISYYYYYYSRPNLHVFPTKTTTLSVVPATHKRVAMESIVPALKVA